MVVARKIGFVFWMITTFILLLVLFMPNLEFKTQTIQLFFLSISTSGIPILLFVTSKDKERKLLVWGVLLLLGTIFFQQMIHFFQFGSGFVTQEILYRSKTDPNHRIEFQMEDVGALGYNRRTVEIKSMGFLQQFQEITVDKIDTTKWDFVGEYKNELNLKGG